MAAPFTPAGDSEIIAKVPAVGDPRIAGIEAARKAFDADPANAVLASALARDYIAFAKAENDPRYVGYAQAIIADYNAKNGYSPALSLLQADILQYKHDFDGALQELDALFKRQPQNFTGLLMKANILQVQGRYKEAAEACKTVGGQMQVETGLFCLLSVKSASGELEPSYDNMTKLSIETTLPPDLQGWALGLLADAADRKGDIDAALGHVERIPAEEAKTPYNTALKADLLLQKGRYDELLSLIAADETRDGLAIRRLIALKRTGAEIPGEARERIEAQFARTAERGETPHLREKALYELFVLEDAEAAYASALENWKTQREPIDIRLLVEAAAKAKKLDDQSEITAWIRDNGYQDESLTKHFTAWEK